MTGGVFGWLANREVSNRKIIVGLKSDNSSRDMLTRLLQLVVVRGDTVLAVHVQQQSDDTFDPNTFQLCEDLCKSKQVEFEVKICNGRCCITELAHQVRITFATILAVGCSSVCPKSSSIAKYVKALPPSCKLLIMDNGGKLLHQEMGTSQQGSSSIASRGSVSSFSEPTTSATRPPVRKSVSLPSSSTSQRTESGKNCRHLRDFPPKFFQRSAVLEAQGHNRRFTLAELNQATENFSPSMLIAEGGKSRVYKGVVENEQGVAVKVFKASKYVEEFFFQEVEVLNSLKHENIVRIVGYCCCREMHAIVYVLVSSNLKQRLNELKWNERMQIAVGVAKALEYLHSSYPPIIHTAVNSSHILLSQDGKPQLSDFGCAKVHFSTHQSSVHKKPVRVIGTFGYLAPEYILYGKVDEKVDVYSFGRLLLEMITGLEATKPNSTSSRQSLALEATSLLTCGLDEGLIDHSLIEEYNKDEMKAMMIVARLCLLHSSSRRPTMKTILHFLEDPNYVLKIQNKNGDLHSQIEPEVNIDFTRHAKSDSSYI